MGTEKATVICPEILVLILDMIFLNMAGSKLLRTHLSTCHLDSDASPRINHPETVLSLHSFGREHYHVASSGQQVR